MIIVTTDIRRLAVPLCAALGVLLSAGCASLPPSTSTSATANPSNVSRATSVASTAAGAPDTTSSAASLPVPGQMLGMHDAVRLALRHGPRMQAVYAELAIADAELAQAGLAENPSLGLEYLTGSEGHLLTAGVMQPLMSLVTLKARRQLGAVQAGIRAQEVRHTAQALAAEVKSAYATVVADARLVELADQALLAAEAAAELAARQYTAGTASRRDQAQQQAAYAQWALESAQAHARLSEHREQLNRLLGLWGPHTAWALPADALALPAHPAEAPEPEARAVAARADLAAALKDHEVRYRQLGLVRDTRWLQSLGLGFVFERETDGAKLRGPHIEVGLPVFDRGQASVARARAELVRSERQLEALAIEIRADARVAAARVRNSHATARHLQHAVLPLHATIVAETQKHYNGMLVGIYDLLLARQQQISAAQRTIEATRDYWLAVAELERVTGGALPAGGMPSPLAPAVESAAPSSSASPAAPASADPHEGHDAPAHNATEQNATDHNAHEHHGDKP